MIISEVKPNGVGWSWRVYGPTKTDCQRTSWPAKGICKRTSAALGSTLRVSS